MGCLFINKKESVPHQQISILKAVCESAFVFQPELNVSVWVRLLYLFLFVRVICGMNLD